ncbi:FG-GAP repeat protein [Patescibacteria group bacterium]|nr:FG-GAP repeat protein [Patescibacteria group bacterium]MBU1890236.1 FG-GAP repeat protein [Patescibacteria group bacterium]
MHKSLKTVITLGIGMFVLVGVLALANIAGAVVQQDNPDPRISSMSASPASTTLGATTTYTFSFTLSQAMTQGGRVMITLQSSGNCEGDWSLCQVNFDNVDEEDVSGISNLHDFNAWEQGLEFGKNTWAAGEYTVTVAGVRNPMQAGGHFRAYAESMATGENQEPCEPGQECPQSPRTASAPIFFGAVGVKGTVTMPNGDPAPNIGVDVRSDDFSVNEHSNTDDFGFYSIMNSSLVSGVSYTIEVRPWGEEYQDYSAPTPIQFTYNGTALTKNAQLRAATKTVTGTVYYDDGTKVGTGFEIWANQPGGGGGGKNVNGENNGTYSLSLAGGQWEIGLNAGWDQENNQQRSVNWTYNMPPTMASFANNDTTETQVVNFIVTKTNAVVKGKVVLPDGTPLQGGNVELRSGGEGPGMNGQINHETGKFSLNVSAGTYKLEVRPDSWNNPEMNKYYLPEQAVTVQVDQTLNLGTLILLEKTSKIIGQVVTDKGVAVPDIWVNCWMTNGSGWGDTQTDDDGAYTIWVAPGTWECRVDQGRNQDSTYISSNSGPPAQYTVAANKTVTADDMVVQEATATLNVKLVDTNGEAISTWGWAFARKNNAMHGPGTEFGGNVDRGTATIPLMGGFTYTVGVHTPPDQSDLLPEKEVEVTVEEGDNKNVFVTMIEPDATINIIVQDQNGVQVTGVDGEVFAETGPGGMWRNSRLDKNGTATIKVKGGLDYNIGYWFHNSPDFVQTHPEMSPTRVGVDATITKVLTAFRANTYVDINLLDPDGDPVEFGFAWCSNHMFMEDKIRGDFEGGKVIDAGTEIRGGTGHLPLISGDYECGSGGGPEMMANNWMPPDMQIVNLTAASPDEITLQYTRADSTITGSGSFDDGTDATWFWCHAFSEEGQFSGGEGFNGTYSIPVNSGSTWFVGCDFHSPDGFFRSQESMVTVSSPGTYTKNIVMSEAEFMIPEGITETFDSTSQKVITLPDGTSINIPANSLATEGNVTLMANPNINLYFTSDTKPLNFAWDFSAVDSNQQLISEFNSNVNICIQYDQEYLDGEGIDEDDIVAKFYDDTNGVWQLPEGVTQDTTADSVCFSVGHFTDFALATGTASTRSGAGSNNYDIAVTPLSGGGPQVILADEDGNVIASFFAYSEALRIGVQVATADVDGDGEYEIITAPGAGAGPQIRVFNHQGELENQFFAYGEGVRTGINLTAADVDGDGTADIIASPMEGAGPQVRIFDAEGNVKNQFFAYAESYRGGLTVATGDVDGDGTNELVVAPASNAGPQIRVLKSDGTAVSQFFAYAESVRGGYNIATGDIDGDGVADIVVSPKAGLGPQVAIYNGSGTQINRYFVYADTFRGGVNASVGDVDGDGDNDVVASPISNAGPQIRVFDGASGTVLSQFWAYSSTLRGNFTSFVADLNGDGTTEIVTGPGTGMGPQVRTFDQDGNALSQFFSHHTGFRGGINITKAL